MKIHEWKVIIWFIFDVKAGMANLNSVRLPVSFTSIMLLDIANRYLLFANSFYFQHFVILLVIYA